MARARFLGPPGSRYEGLELRMIRPGGAKLRDLSALQRETGLRMPEVQAQIEGNESFAIQVVVYLTLRNAGLFVTLDEAGDFAEDEIEWVAEPGDTTTQDGGEPDPTSARTASAPGDAAPAAPRPPGSSPRKRKNRGSRSRSGGGSSRSRTSGQGSPRPPSPS